MCLYVLLCLLRMCVCVWCVLCVLVLSAPPSHPARCLEMVSPVAAAVCDLFHLFGLLLILVFVFISLSLSFAHTLSFFVFLFCQSRTQIKLTSCLSIANSKLIRASGQFLAKWLAVSPAQPCLLLVWIPVCPLSFSLSFSFFFLLSGWVDSVCSLRLWHPQQLLQPRAAAACWRPSLTHIAPAMFPLEWNSPCSTFLQDLPAGVLQYLIRRCTSSLHFFLSM